MYRSLLIHMCRHIQFAKLYACKSSTGMYVCAHVSMSFSPCVHVCLRLHVCVRANVRVDVRSHVHAHSYMHTHTCMHTVIHIHIHIHVDVHIHIHAHLYTHTHTCTYALTYTYTFTHTHPATSPLLRGDLGRTIPYITKIVAEDPFDKDQVRNKLKVCTRKKLHVQGGEDP